MTQKISSRLNLALNKALSYIQSIQLPSGAIPWYKSGKLDPWNHCEALMALSVAGRFAEFEKGFSWLLAQQLENGAWYAKLLGDTNDGDKDRQKIETNFVAYPATALWHYLMSGGSENTAQQYFPAIERAVEYVLSQQHAEGEINWAVSSVETLPKDALVTASASILRSLESAIFLAERLSSAPIHWRRAHCALANALKNKPWRFDRSWESKARFSMDWFYPILSGVYSEQEAQLRLNQSWDKFVQRGLGCRCVSDQPWVTIAETCELIMALVAAGQHREAQSMLQDLLRWQDKDGGFWTGYQFKNNCIWPQEKTTWTAGAFVLASDAVFGLSGATGLFTRASGFFIE